MVIQTDRCFACTGCPHAPRRGIGVRTRRRHLAAAALTALVVRRVSGYENRPSPACASRRATLKGVERAPGSGLLLPPCVVERRKERGGRGGPCRGVVKAGARSLRPCDGEGAGIFPQKSGKMRKADAVRRVPGFLALLAPLPFKSLPQSQAGCFSALPKNTLLDFGVKDLNGSRANKARRPGTRRTASAFRLTPLF